jgi:hypothetical protein
VDDAAGAMSVSLALGHRVQLHAVPPSPRDPRVPGVPRRNAAGGALGRAVQVDPTKPKLKPPGTKRLKLKCDILPSTSAFKFNLRRYTSERQYVAMWSQARGLFERALHRR